MSEFVIPRANPLMPHALPCSPPRCTAMMAWRFMSIYLQNELLFTLTHPWHKLRQMKLIRTMHEFTINVIEKRRQVLEEEHKQQEITKQPDDLGQKRRMALLDVLLQASVDGRPLRNDEIREEVDTFMFEGHDTTTSAISFCLWEISRDAKVQAQLLEEILQVLGTDRSRAVTTRDLNEMKYLECVIKESLRMHPSVPLVGRKLQSDFKYSECQPAPSLRSSSSNPLSPFSPLQTWCWRHTRRHGTAPGHHWCPEYGGKLPRAVALQAGTPCERRTCCDLCLPALQCGTKELHWPEVCHARDEDDAGEDCACL